MKRINLNEEFILVGSGVYEFVQKEKGVSLKFIRETYKNHTPKKKSFIPPTLQNVKDYFKEKG